MRLGYQPIDTPGTEMYHPSNGSPRTANTWGRQNSKGDQTLGYLGVVNPVTPEEGVPLRGSCGKSPVSFLTPDEVQILRSITVTESPISLFPTVLESTVVKEENVENTGSHSEDSSKSPALQDGKTPPAVQIGSANSPIHMQQVEYFPFSLRCAFCDIELSSPSSFSEHILEIHSGCSESQIGVIQRRENQSPSPPSSGEKNQTENLCASSEEESPPFSCEKCKDKFENEASLLQHICYPSPFRSWSCVLCNHVAFKRRGLRFHMKNKHSSWKVRTDEFGLPVANLTPVAHRVPNAKRVKFSLPQTDGTPPPCILSSKSSPRDSQQSDLLSHEPPLLPTVEAGRPSLDLPTLDSQVITKFQCKKCSFEGPSENVVEAHMYDAHSPVFSSSYETTRCCSSPHIEATCGNHVSPTESETPVSARLQKCPLCSAICSNSVELLTHTCGAVGGEPDPPADSPNRNCPVCGFIVRAADEKVDSILRRHVYNKHSCQRCKFVEKMNGELKNHMRQCRGRLPSSGAIPKTSMGSQDKNTSNTIPPSKQSVVPLAKNPSQVGPRQPAHECENCGLKFTFKAHFELHCKSCHVASRRTNSGSNISTQLPLNKCRNCPFVGKNMEALNLHMTIAHSSVKSGLLPSQHPIRSNSSSIRPPPADRCEFDISFTNSQPGANGNAPGTPPCSQPVGNNSVLNDTPVSQESDLPSSRSQVRSDLPPSSIPNETCRIGNAINILFPISGFLPCTEASCGFKSFGSSYNICKRSLKRHLETHHKLQIRACHFWCFLCQCRITRHPAAHGCFKNSALLIPPDRPFEWKCDACDLSFPTEIGLKNHSLAHKLRNIKNSGAPLTLVKPKSIPRRARFAPVVPEPGDEFLPVPGAPINTDRLDILTPPATNSEEDSSILKPYITEIAALLEVDATEGSFNYFCNIVDQAVAEIQSSVLNGPPRDFASSSPAPPVNTKDPK
ncbi:hypothetical protein AVEN_96819-1 [Araneus ventricosus]|uniref:C2H2-type domain-containing protein n=1 Tax=Araneus ventricosus TaxID=182803 RepID=A0A4Y1ZJV7_ARAVE|nr:hypothetical protein AVEN_96819-1 [Araneus ventricosus]